MTRYDHVVHHLIWIRMLSHGLMQMLSGLVLYWNKDTEKAFDTPWLKPAGLQTVQSRSTPQHSWN